MYIYIYTHIYIFGPTLTLSSMSIPIIPRPSVRALWEPQIRGVLGEFIQQDL